MNNGGPIGFQLPVEWSRPTAFEVRPIPQSGCRIVKISSRNQTDNKSENEFGIFETQALKYAESRIVDELKEKTSLGHIVGHIANVREAAERQVGRCGRSAEATLKYLRGNLKPWIAEVVEALGGPTEKPPLGCYVREVLEASSEMGATAVEYSQVSSKLTAHQREWAVLEKAVIKYHERHGAYALFAAEMMLLWGNLRGEQRMPFVLESIAQHVAANVPKSLVEQVYESRVELRKIDLSALDAIALRTACDVVETYYLETGRLPTAEEVKESGSRQLAEDATLRTFEAVVRTLSNPPRKRTNFVDDICKAAGQRLDTPLGGHAVLDHLKRIVPKLRDWYPGHTLPNGFRVKEWLKEETTQNATEILERLNKGSNRINS